MTLAEAEVKQFINVFARLKDNVFADNADVSRAVLNISRNVGGLRYDELEPRRVVSDDKLARFFVKSFSRPTDFSEEFR